jgi:hypothetical protein
MLSLAAIAFALSACTAFASGNQDSIFQEDTGILSNPTGTLRQLRLLGVTRVRVTVSWNAIAPRPSSRTKPRGFSPSDPSSYPAANWGPYDAIVQEAQNQGIGVYFVLTGPAPLWATGPRPRDNAKGEWMPSGNEFASFVRAVGKRYSGTYSSGASTLPRVQFWSVWNEPNYGIDLAPQATEPAAVELAPALYRDLVDGAWKGLHDSGHGRDTILIGELAPRGHWGGNLPGVHDGIKPLRFLRALYCADANYNQLRGRAAAARGCPTTSAGSRAFRGAHPGLFQASGFAQHPYEQGVAPDTPTSSDPSRYASDPDYADLPTVPREERVLDRLNRIYGSGTRFPIYNTEYSYWTRPPSPPYSTGIPPERAAFYINWAEYIHWSQPRMKSYMQYLLVDPPKGNFAGALEFHNGRHKPQLYDAYRLPLFLPVTTTRRGRSLEVWGCVRPAHFADNVTGSGQTVDIQFRPGSRGSFVTQRTVTLSANGNCYFDVRTAFHGSGTVRLKWTYPFGTTVYSRPVAITVR